MEATTPLTDEQIATLATVPIFETVAPDVLRWIVRRVEFEHYISNETGLEAAGIERMNPPPNPAWEPLTTEVLLRIWNMQDPEPCFWVVGKDWERPFLARFTGVDEFKGFEHVFHASNITHIMPFTTPEMPK